MARRSYAGNTQPTTLASPITNVDSALTVIAGTNYPDGSAGPAILTLDAGVAGEEKVLYTSRTGNVFSGLTRGYDGTTAVSHSAGASVRHSFSALDANEANAHVNVTTQDDHTQYAKRGQGLASNVGAASRAGRFYIATDSEDLYADDGTTVHRYLSKTATDAAYVARGSAVSPPAVGSESTSSTTYTDLTTVGPSATVTIGASGLALVTVSAKIVPSGTTVTGYMGVAVSGATTIAASDANALEYQAFTPGAEGQGSFTFLAQGLTAGSNTFRAKYRAGTANSVTFTNRQITVLPL